MKRVHLVAIALFAVLMSIALLLPLSAIAAPSQPTTARHTTSTTADPFKGIPVTGTVTNSGGQTVGTFSGTLTVQKFAAQNGQLAALGTLSGKLINKNGQVIGTITNKSVTLPTAIPNATCTILDLVLGPLHLDVLGLVVDLNQVHLTITAHRGSLLGDLLCDIAHLLNKGGPLSQIVIDLNKILNLLG